MYWKRNEMHVLRTGVDLKDFKVRNKEKVKKQLNLNKNNFYGLYLGAGSGWNKGLDRTLQVSREIYKINPNYKLIIIGPDYLNIKKYLGEPFILYKGKIPRKDIPFYYNASEIVFCLSRYEGGAPIMVASEAMGSGSIVVCSKSSNQEVIVDELNGLVLEEFEKKDAKKIMGVLESKDKMNKINKEAKKITEKISIDKWRKRYFDILNVK